jgi:hypothetical protein
MLLGYADYRRRQNEQRRRQLHRPTTKCGVTSDILLPIGHVEGMLGQTRANDIDNETLNNTPGRLIGRVAASYPLARG